MSDVIFSEIGEKIFEFKDDGMSLFSLASMLLSAKFSPDPRYDVLFGDGVNDLVRSILTHYDELYKKDLHKRMLFGRANGWPGKLDDSTNDTITNVIKEYKDRIGWRDFDKSNKIAFLHKAFYPWVQPEDTIQTILDDIDG